MTLSTHVYLLTEADPRDVFFECRRILGAGDRVQWFEDAPDDRWRDYHILRNRAGSGLNALLYLRHRPDEMLRATNDCDEDCEPDCTGDWHTPPHWVDLDFDTAYGFHDEYGGCGALHARLLFELGGWLDERGVMWAWKNEFSGEVHVGDKYAHLRDLIGDGQRAMRWFKEVVEPVIATIGVGTNRTACPQNAHTDDGGSPS